MPTTRFTTVMCFIMKKFKHIWGCPYTVRSKLNKFEHVGESWDSLQREIGARALYREEPGSCSGVLGSCTEEGVRTRALYRDTPVSLNRMTDTTENITFLDLP